MAVDTAAKRFSMMDFGDGAINGLVFEPDGSVDLDDRQHLLGLYGGIALGAPVVAAGLLDDVTTIDDITTVTVWMLVLLRGIFR